MILWPWQMAISSYDEMMPARRPVLTAVYMLSPVII